MGMFDSMLGGMQGSSRLNEREAFAGILLAASACDGHIADDEVQSLVTALIRMKLYSRFSDRDFNKMLNKLVGIIKRKGVETLLDACAESLPESLDKAAFTNAVNIVLADGIVEPEEKEFIEDLKDALGIDDKTCKSIIRVMVIKNKG